METTHAAPRKRSAQTRVAESVRAAILAGELEPGDPITELHLAELHKVSQTTVREALVRLEQGGYVRRIPNRGTFVTNLSATEFREHLRLRLMLEMLATADAARNARPHHIAELTSLLDELSRVVDANDYMGLAEADLKFHRHVWRIGGDQTLARILEQLTAPMMIYASLRRRSRREDLHEMVLSHEPILRSIESRDAERARQAIRTHITGSYHVFLPGDDADL